MLTHYSGDKRQAIRHQIQTRVIDTLSVKALMGGLLMLGVTNTGITYAADSPSSQATMARLLPDNELIVTGVYRSQAQALSTQPLETLTAEEITAIAPADTSTLLRNVRGLLVNQQGGLGGVSEVSIRGSESNFVSAFIDGVAVNDPVNSRGGSFNFNALSPAIIDKIEVLRGPNSAIYSSGALGGAIHVVTLTPSDTPLGSLSLDAGERGYTNGSFKFTGRTDKIDYGVRVASLDSGSDMPESRYQSDEMAGLLRYQFTDEVHTQFNFRYANDKRESLPEQSGGPLYAVDRQLENGSSEEWNGHFLLQAKHNAWWQSHIEASYFNRRSNTLSPGIFPYSAIPATEDHTDYQRSQWRWTNTLGKQPEAAKPNESQGSLWFNIGAEKARESGNSQGFVDFGFALPTDFELDRDSTGVFANANVLSRKGWLLQISARHDNPDTTSTQSAYQAGLSSPLFFNEHLKMSLNWGQAYKLPSFFALAHPLVGNRQLTPEQAEGWTLNLDWKLAEPLNTQLSLFANKYKDLVDFDATLFKNVNRSSVKNSGADIAIQWQALQSILIAANATYTDIDVEDNASKLTGRPQWSANARLEHQINDTVSAHVNFRWKDQQFASSLHTGVPITESLDAYGVLDMNLQWQVSNQLSTSIRLENVTNKYYQEAVGFVGQSRRARINFTLDF